MRVNIYKPNSSSSGCACSFQVADNGTLYVNAIQQFSWNADKRTASFSENVKKDGKFVNIKFNEFECGAMIRAIRNLTEVSFFHSFERDSHKDTTQISFKPWVKNQKDIDSASSDQKPTPVYAFGLSITRNSTDKFKLPIELGEAEVILRVLEHAIDRKLIANAEKKETPSPQ